VVGIISPWNYPVNLSLMPVVTAIAAGNRVMLKPSKLTPATNAVLASMFSELFPEEQVAMVSGDGSAFSSLPFDHLVFTGSTAVGRAVMKAASENLVPVTLELGGKSPAIVHADYPIARAAERILTGKLYNAGQTCVAPDYLLVPRGRRDAFVDAARQIVPRMFPSLSTGRDYTRIINAQHYQRLQTLLDDAQRRGATVIALGDGDGRYDATTRVCPPTLLTDVRDDMAIMQEEIFGPLLPIVEYDQLDDALAYVNARPRPLALYYFDDDRTRVDLVLERSVTGGVTINDCLFHVGQAGLPFGGVGPSGMGRYHGVHGFRTFSNAKGVLLQRRWSPLALLRPPYTARTSALLRLLIR
jgi:coniferyl-aldehyde dehydrogenase